MDNLKKHLEFKDVNIKRLITNLDDLCKRLQDDYNGGEIFSQSEEDRLTVYTAIELIESYYKQQEV